MKLFLGLDGGGTHTRALLVDETGQPQGWGEAGLSNPIHASAQDVQANLAHAVEKAFARGEFKRENCLSVFAGMSGTTTQTGRDRIHSLIQGLGFHQATVGVDHDIRIALAGGLEGKPGIALIVGTGSSCYGRRGDGATWQTGGWEALISDEGSAFFIGREAIAAAARMADGRSPETPLRAAVFDWLEIKEISAILPRVHDRGLTRSAIAAFAPSVVSMAEAGDPSAREILNRGAVLLAEMVQANHQKLPTGPGPEMVITGGLGTAETAYRKSIESEISQRLPTVKIRKPSLSPVAGAVLLAMEQMGCAVDSTVRSRIGTVIDSRSGNSQRRSE